MKARFPAGKPAQDKEYTSTTILNVPGVGLPLNVCRALQI
jgi:hypothetical protein